jgi:hypothetical protein
MALDMDDLKKKYEEASYYLDANYRLAFDTWRLGNCYWIDEKLLVRLFWQANEEWMKDFRETARKYEFHNRTSAGLILEWESKLEEKIEKFKARRARVVDKYK